MSHETKRLEIRKYPNRRYYDSTHSRHLTLEEIRSLVEQGYDIEVTDAKTGADITAQVLIQIIVELDTVKLDSLPVPLLVHLIRVNDQFVKSFVNNYLWKAMQAFTDYQKQWQEQLRNAQPFSAPFPNMTGWTEAMLRPFTAGDRTPKPAAEAATKPQPPPEDQDLREMVRDLQEQISALQQKKLRKKGAKKQRR